MKAKAVRAIRHKTAGHEPLPWQAGRQGSVLYHEHPGTQPTCLPCLNTTIPRGETLMIDEPFNDDLDDDLDNSDTPRPPSKSQRKRDATALQDLGARLVELSATRLNQIPLPDELLAAVRMAQATTQRGARKRQLQYIGKLMRRIEDPEAIRQALDGLSAPARSRHSN